MYKPWEVHKKVVLLVMEEMWAQVGFGSTYINSNASSIFARLYRSHESNGQRRKEWFKLTYQLVLEGGLVRRVVLYLGF